MLCCWVRFVLLLHLVDAFEIRLILAYFELVISHIYQSFFPLQYCYLCLLVYVFAHLYMLNLFVDELRKGA